MTLRHGTRVVMIGLLALAALGSCDKKKGTGTSGSPEGGGKPTPPPASAPSSTPTLFAHVPADTPYLFGMLAPVPTEYWDWAGAIFSKDADKLIDAAMAKVPEDDKLGKVLLTELKGNVNAAGFKKLFGVDTSAKIVFYGVGFTPVFRLELADPKALPATIDRVAKAAEKTIPVSNKDGHPYYTIPVMGDTSVIVAIADSQLVISGGDAATVEKILPHVLGLAKPQNAMTDAAPLRDVIKKHGYGPWAGYADTVKLASMVPPDPSMKDHTACVAALTGEAKRMPRVSLGYTTWTAKLATAKIVAELDPALAKRLEGLVVEMPGLSASSGDVGLMTFGVGMNLDAGRQILSDVTEVGIRLASVCGGEDAVEELRKFSTQLAQPLPPMLAGVKGAVLTLLDAKMEGGQPSNVSGYLLVAADDPGKLLAALGALSGLPALEKLEKDGKFHEVMPAGTVPVVGAIQAAASSNALAAAVGPTGPDAALKAMGSKPAKAPLLLLAYDYSKFMAVVMSMMPDNDDAFTSMAKRFVMSLGKISMWATPSSQGLEVMMTIQLNAPQ